jgi:hypothetical protein
MWPRVAKKNCFTSSSVGKPNHWVVLQSEICVPETIENGDPLQVEEYTEKNS